MRFIMAPVAAAAFFGLYSTAQATVRVHIDLGSQTMHVTSGSGAEYDWAVSTGRPGHRTPTGSYRPQRMYVMVHSAKYDNAPMPHSIFFTGGYAIHGTGSVGMLGHVASHGCVRLAPENAAALFEMVKQEGATIAISGNAPGGEAVAEREPHRGGHRLAAQTPEAAPSDEVFAEREPHRGGQRLAAQMRIRWHEEALGYAPRPRHRARSLWDWANNPIGNF